MENLLSLESISCIQDRILSIEVHQKNQLHISSIASLAKRETTDGKSSSLIALGTLECIIYLISPPKYLVIEQFQLSSAIIQIETIGSYLGDYRIYALCADDCLYVVSRSF